MTPIRSEILSWVGQDPVSAVELCERHGAGVKVATVSRHLRALADEGYLTRRWDGEAYFGRYLYRRPRNDVAGQQFTEWLLSPAKIRLRVYQGD